MPAGRPSSYTDASEIYALCCPDTGDVRYIGKAHDSAQRLKTHIRDARRKNTPVYCWIRALIAAGKFPLMHVVMVTLDWKSSEIACIAQHTADGARLLNLAVGGNEPYCSPEQRRLNGPLGAASRQADSLSRRIWLIKRTLGQSLKEGFVREETKDKLRGLAQKNPRLFGLWANI